MPTAELRGKISLDGSQWRAGLQRARGEANKWSADVASMVRGRLLRAFAIGAVIRGVDRKTAEAGQIRDQSNALGLDIETFQKADFAAQQSAASIDDVAKATKRLSVATADALRGSKDIKEAFARFGITAEKLNALKARPGDLLFLLADLVKQGVNITELGDIQKIAGRSGSNLLPAFRAGFAQAGQDAVDRGAIIPEEEIRKLAAAGDEITTQKAVVDRFVTKGLFNAVRTVEAVGGLVKSAAESRAAFAQNEEIDKRLAEIEKNTRKTTENTNVLNR